jgi:hypothetical protein
MVEAVCQEPVQIDLSDGRQEQASQKASPLKIPQPRHLGQMADRSSPPLLSSPGGSTDSCLTVNMSSPFSLHLSGPVSCHTFASTHNKMSFQSASQSTQSLTFSVIMFFFVDCTVLWQQDDFSSMVLQKQLMKWKLYHLIYLN